ncbi:long-chain fatty acid--CoA ligase [Dysgonomonas sp. 520]|uniref:AMP-dependent synthetase/ligase n=1 Tax=Dysgonomonas sp. 520 TaxID=2302931 RepID=UPI0013D8D23E|nr:AMP-binding protein [Dysgonomonas sp. 520]NDW09136.1 long-chain fatty acid--CoA ligase [Dysgonomonas sp. 520]
MKTIINLFNESVEKYKDKSFLWEKTADQFSPLTYGQTKQKVYQLASGLLSLGIKKGDKVALLSEGRNDWIITELAILHLGAVNVPLSIKLEESNDLLFRLKHSETKYIIVSGGQLKKIRAIINDLPDIVKVVVYDISADLQDKEISYTEVCKIGTDNLDKNRAQIEASSLDVKGSDIANISYTSGTTADPKGILLSHRNYTANVEQAMSLIKIDPEDSNLIILPLDHCFAHVAGFYTFMAYGANVATVQRGKTPAEALRNIPLNIKEFKPTVIMSVPALAKNFRKNIEANIKSKGDFTVKLFNHALKTAYAYNKEGYNKKKNPFTKLLLNVYDKILFSKVREAFGGRLKFFIGGGALLDIELQRFFYAIGIPMLQGYGLSEATPIISANALHRHKLGSSGFLVSNLELKICDEDGKELPLGEKGEIVVKGENVMLGYWKNDKATADTVKNGWLYTGDMGYMDNDGFLYVLGRFKSLLISSDGEKYAPEGIEESIVEKTPYVDQIILHNNQDPYTVALAVPNVPNLKEAVKKIHPHLEWDSKEAKEQALMLIQESIDKYKSKGEFAGEFPERWLPAAVAVLPEPFTEQNHMVNSTMKIVRGKVEEVYKDRIDFLYTPDGKKIINEKNINSL